MWHAAALFCNSASQGGRTVAENPNGEKSLRGVFA